MKTKRDVLRLAKQMGCEVHVNYSGARGLDVGVEAPYGHHFDDGLHEYVQCSINGSGSPMYPASELWTEIYRRLEESKVSPCGPDCEWWGETLTVDEFRARFGVEPRRT